MGLQVPLANSEFIEWIGDTFAQQHGETPSVYTLREARNAFEARVWFANEPHRRLARHPRRRPLLLQTTRRPTAPAPPAY